MTETQPDLFDTVMGMNPEFADYVRKHPQAYEEFARETLASIRRGERLPMGAKAVTERCRAKVLSRSPGGYGIDNRWVTLLSRLFEEKHGSEVFRKRRCRA